MILMARSSAYPALAASPLTWASAAATAECARATPSGVQPRSCWRTLSIFHGGMPSSAASAPAPLPRDAVPTRPSARALGRVGTASRGKGAGALAAELGMPPWKIDKVRQQLRGWTPEGVARAHSAVAAADAQVKGEAASAGYALERAIRIIVACRSRS